MKLISMEQKKEPKDKKQKCGIEACDSAKKYPWGLRINFDSENVSKVSALSDVSVGDVVTIQAKAHVVETSARETQSGPDRRVELQIVSIGIEADVDAEKAFDQGAE
jgi:hypothetical protein